jgi:hypothetical protein
MSAVASLGATLAAHPHRGRHARRTVVHCLHRLDSPRVDECAVPQDVRLTMGARISAGPHDADAVDVVPVVKSPCALAAEPVLAGEAARPAMEPDRLRRRSRPQLWRRRRRRWLGVREALAGRGANTGATVAESEDGAE